MDVIKERIVSTITNLEEKRAILVKHKAQYNDLKFRLMDFAQYKETDQPKVDVRLNSKAIVKGHIVNPQKVLVFLGCEYFVERDPTESVALVENKLKYLNKAISEFDSKIKEAKKTIENIGHLEDYEKKQSDQKTETIPKVVPVKQVAEDLPFIDIREELDEDGNVINSTVQKQDENRIKEFGAKHGIKVDDDSDDQLNELLKDMEIKPRPKIEELPTEVSQIISANVIPKSFEKKSVKDVLGETSLTKKESVTSSKEQDEYYKLLKQMGISDARTENKESESNSKLEQETSTPLGNPNPDMPNPSQTVSVQETSSSDENQWDQGVPAIDQDDILQLQLIADEIEEEGEYDYDEEDIENAFDQDDEDDEDDEEEDWDFTSNPETLVPEAHRTLFARELERVRAEKAKLDTPVDTKDEPIENVTPKKKKSVSFAPELQIKEIENVSEELKNAPDISRVSKFKQMRMTNPAQLDDEIQEGEIFEAHVSDVIVEKNLPEPVIERSISETVMSEIREKKDEDVIPEPPKPRISKFKQRIGVAQISSSPINDIIVEREPINDIVESKNQPEPIKPKVSRFKSSKQQSKGNVISIPEAEPHYVPEEDDYNNIKAYIQNEQDDEDELNALTDLEIYTAADLDGDAEFNEDDFDDEEEEEENFSNALANEIVENDEVDDPSYYIDDNLLQKEYQDLKKKMIAKYMEANGNNAGKIITKEEEHNELEPIDESGNPIRVSKFKKSIGK